MRSQRTFEPAFSGTRPAGTQNEGEAARAVREMFGRIAPRYDFLNRLLSLSFDQLWRRRTAHRFRHILRRPGACVLDLCCGTGDLALAFKEARDKEAGGQERRPEEGSGGGAAIVGVDFVHPMLVLARQKTRAGREGRGSRRAVEQDQDETVAVPEARVFYVEADALEMPLANSSFDLITAAFGFRNLANYERGLREILRLLRPGGEVGILDFSEPRAPFFASFYRFYFERLLPRIGGAISGSRAAYTYLPNSVVKFPLPEALRDLMAALGFADARFELWTGGIVALHTARRR